MLARTRNPAPQAAAVAALAALFGLLAAAGSARVVPVRTLMVSGPPAPGQADGHSANPVLADGARVVAFDTAATHFVPYDINGNVRDVVVVNFDDGQRTVVSAGGDGPSSNPAIAASGRRVAFASKASNLTPGDVNGVSDILVRDGTGPIERASMPTGGGVANGPSWDPDLSADGRFVVFTSSATNLVESDRNARADIFLRDLVKRETVRLSVASSGAEANGASGAAAISANGRVVSFASSASNLVARDTNGIGDVFVRLVRSGVTERVSVASRGGQQNKAVASPFVQVSDVSSNGRYVVFDSDATNLVARDGNRRTDVFRRDRSTRRTILVSASSTYRQGNNDSFAPTITPSGRFVAFQSFASNLAPGNVPGEDVFVRNLRTQTTSIANVPATGGRRAPELVKQLLQRPALSGDGDRVAFTSTAPGFVPSDRDRFEDVFVRLLAPPKGRITGRGGPGRRPSVGLAADDPQATHFICRIDARRPFLCRPGTVRAPVGLRAGRHLLRVRAGGPGMLYDPVALTVTLRVTG